MGFGTSLFGHRCPAALRGWDALPDTAVAFPPLHPKLGTLPPDVAILLAFLSLPVGSPAPNVGHWDCHLPVSSAPGSPGNAPGLCVPPDWVERCPTWRGTEFKLCAWLLAQGVPRGCPSLLFTDLVRRWRGGGVAGGMLTVTLEERVFEKFLPPPASP